MSTWSLPQGGWRLCFRLRFWGKWLGLQLTMEPQVAPDSASHINSFYVYEPVKLMQSMYPMRFTKPMKSMPGGWAEPMQPMNPMPVGRAEPMKPMQPQLALKSVEWIFELPNSHILDATPQNQCQKNTNAHLALIATPETNTTIYWLQPLFYFWIGGGGHIPETNTTTVQPTLLECRVDFFPHPGGAFCTLLELPNSHILQNMIFWYF